MRRPLAAVVVVLAVLVMSAATAFALTVNGDRSQGPRGWMHGSAVDAEFGYLTEMVAHHGEAVAAAQELQRSARPEAQSRGADWEARPRS